jgi:hypothetical protein
MTLRLKLMDFLLQLTNLNLQNIILGKYFNNKNKIKVT